MKNLIALLLLFVLSGCVSATLKTEQTAEIGSGSGVTPVASPNADLSDQTGSNAVDGKVSVSLEASLLEDSAKVNEKAALETEGDIKVIDRAAASGDKEECDKIADEERQSACKDNVILQKAIKEQNTALCAQINYAPAKEECKVVAQKR